MLRDEKNLKDEKTTLGIVLKDNNTPLSYTKTNKLITALYMVTDIMDTEEPLRNKLRTLGANIVSDTYVIQQNHAGCIVPTNAISKIAEIMSFLDIAGAVNLISEMNANILRKEFFELKESIDESTQVSKPSYSEVNLSELFKNDSSLPSGTKTSPARNTSNNASESTRIGVQRGSTLMKALSKIGMSDRTKMPARPIGGPACPVGRSDKKTRKPNANFEVRKGQRRNEIVSIIKASLNGATITDIKTGATGSLISCGEKTIQRELIGMVKDGVLKKTGEKRWSKYFLA